MKTWVRKVEPFAFWAMVTFCVLWPLWFLNKGIDVTDTVWLLTGYKYAFTGHSVSFIQWFGNDFVGGAIFKILPSHQLLVFNVIQYLSVLGVAALVYFIFRAYAPRTVIMIGVLFSSLFMRIFLAIFGYNSLSQLLLVLALLLLYRSLEKENSKLTALSGFLLGLNIFVRFPNGLFLGLVVPLFLYYAIPESKTKLAIKQCSIFIGGALGGALSMLGAALLVMGPSRVKASFQSFLYMGSSGGSHGISQMLKAVLDVFWGQREYIFIFIILVVIAGLIIAFASLSDRTKGKSIASSGWLLVAVMLLAAGSMGYYVRATFFNMHWAGFLGLLVLFVNTPLWYLARKKNSRLSFLMLSTVMIALAIPVGSNNLTVTYNAFPFIPIVGLLVALWQLPNYLPKLVNSRPVMSCALYYGRYVAIAVLIVSSVGIIGFTGMKRVYGVQDLAMETHKTQIPELKGMLTTAENAAWLDWYRNIGQKYPKYEVIALSPAGTAAPLAANLPPFFTTTWIHENILLQDSEFAEQLANKTERGVLPLVILSDESFEGQFAHRAVLVEEMMIRYGYKEVERNGSVHVYVPDAGPSK